MKRRALFGGVLLLAGCSGPAPVVFNPKYREAELKDRVLHVLPIRGLHVLNTDDLSDDFPEAAAGSDAGRVIGRLFEQSLVRYSHHVALVFGSGWYLPPDMRDTLLELPGRKGPMQANFSFPPAHFFEGQGVKPDLALMLANLEFKRSTQRRSEVGLPASNTTISPVGPSRRGSILEGGRTRWLELSGSYLLWDYCAGEPVAYGRFAVSSPFGWFMDRSNWQAVADHATFAMVENSPLKATCTPLPRGSHLCLEDTVP